jgi:hypothetical protein
LKVPLLGTNRHEVETRGFLSTVGTRVPRYYRTAVLSYTAVQL